MEPGLLLSNYRTALWTGHIHPPMLSLKLYNNINMKDINFYLMVFMGRTFEMSRLIHETAQKGQDQKQYRNTSEYSFNYVTHHPKTFLLVWSLFWASKLTYPSHTPGFIHHYQNVVNIFCHPCLLTIINLTDLYHSYTPFCLIYNEIIFIVN